MEIKQTLLNRRLVELTEIQNDLPKLENLYFLIGADIGFLNQSLIMELPAIQNEKMNIKENTKSIAQFEREFELTNTYITLQNYKLQIKGLEKIMAGIRVKIEGLRAEVKSQY